MKLLEQWLIIDRSIDEFYELSFSDISLYIQGYAAREKRESQKRASDIYVLAQLIGINVAQLFSDKAKVPEIEKIFPHLFDEPKQEKVEEGKLDRAQSAFLAGLLNSNRVNIIDNSQDKEN